jgi:hypothetical protein
MSPKRPDLLPLQRPAPAGPAGPVITG